MRKPDRTHLRQLRPAGIGGVLLAATLLVAVATLPLDARAVAVDANADFVDLGWSSLLPGLAMAVPGPLLVSRMPKHAVAWVLTLGGLFWAVDGLAAAGWSTRPHRTRPGPVPISRSCCSSALGAALLLILPLLLVLFPDGRLPAGWWGRGCLLSLASTALLPLTLVFVPSHIAEEQAAEPLSRSTPALTSTR